MRTIDRTNVVRFPLLVSCAVLAGCHTWKAQPLPVKTPVRWDVPIRVHLALGQRFEFDMARVSGDTLFGTPRRERPDSTVALPLPHVVRVERRALSGPRTTGVVIGSAVSAAALVLTAWYIAAASAWNDS